MHFSPRVALVLAAIIASFCGPAALRADDRVDYRTQVKPLLARCFVCHGALKQESGLRLDAGSLILKGGDDGAVVVPGKSGESLLVEAVSRTDPETRMPKEGAPLSSDEIDILKKWIDQGAKVPDEAIPPDPRKHWAFIPPQRVPLPEPKDARWSGNAVDRFIAASHEAHGLNPLDVTDRATLLRRVYLDLIGLTPTADALRDFLRDDSQDAYDRVVDRLLASPQYGERWGRHFMDVWRYSDWAGYGNEIRNSQYHIWRWRDWIVESLNENKPYDRMIVEMLAADEVTPDDPAALRATGFLARNWFKFNRNVWLQDTVEHTGKAFLGLTINCARCHDHMFDPISSDEYHRFRAIFESHDVRTDRVPGQSDLMKDGLPRVYDAYAERPTYRFIRGDERKVDEATKYEAGVPAILGGEFKIEPVELPARAWYPGLAEFVQTETLATARQQAVAAEAALVKAQGALASADASVAAAEKAPAPTDDPLDVEKPALAGSEIIKDNFAKADPQVWTIGAGQWEYADGVLRQKQAGAQFSEIVSVADHPRDFLARVRFKTTGGQQWKSVGISFDRQDEANYDAVYLSAVAGGPKLQFLHQRAAQTSYPTGGMVAFPAAVGREYLLELAVRDKLCNVFIDGQLVLVYKLGDSRRDGKLAIWTFDASADFFSAELFALAEGAKLAEKVSGEAAQAAVALDPQTALRQAQRAVTLSEKQLLAAQANVAWVEARIAADKARYATPPASDADALALLAGKAQLQVALCRADEARWKAESDLATAKETARTDDAKSKESLAAAEKKLAEAVKAFEAAQKATENPTAAYDPLTAQYPKTSTGRRLALARWIADRGNPLTARVLVNHVWLRHFGQPLVPSVSDFGLHGQPPSHPDLLDHLAVEFMDRGWDLKWLHRTLVTSRAYRLQSSPPSSAAALAAANAKIDPDNRFLWRMNVRRMEGEVLRDAILCVAGRLDLKMGGPEIDHAQGETVLRRSLYFRHAHEKQMTFLKLFDAANVNECYRRNESLIPQQALVVANSAIARESARVLAGKLSGKSASEVSDAAFVRAAFEQVLSRPPRDAEQSECEKFLTEQPQRLSAAADTKPATFGGQGYKVAPSADARQRARESLVHVLLNHNDFVTIR
ncbi:MAG: DUF1553 domain-containing protein [Planctomycetia bacterium]|nr:DUF1553 domain-containing protein [Planctomycetia bacterium]